MLVWSASAKLIYVQLLLSASFFIFVDMVTYLYYGLLVVDLRIIFIKLLSVYLTFFQKI